MTRGLQWGVPIGLLVGVVTILFLHAHKVHGPLGGLVAAGITGLAIFLVSQLVDRRGRDRRDG